MAHVLTANRLTDGRVVYLSKDEQWSTRLEDALRINPDDLDHAQAVGRSAESGNLIVDSYAVELSENSPQEPSRLRERIRGFGPTVGDHNTHVVSGPEG